MEALQISPLENIAYNLPVQKQRMDNEGKLQEQGNPFWKGGRYTVISFFFFPPSPPSPPQKVVLHLQDQAL